METIRNYGEILKKIDESHEREMKYLMNIIPGLAQTKLNLEYIQTKDDKSILPF